MAPCGKGPLAPFFEAYYPSDLKCFKLQTMLFSLRTIQRFRKSARLIPINILREPPISFANLNSIDSREFKMTWYSVMNLI